MEIAEYDKAIENLKKSMEMALKNNLNDRYLIASTYLASVWGRLKQYDKAIEIQQLELKNKRNQQYALYGGFVLVLAFAGFIYNRFKVTQKQKVVIEQQKEAVEQAHLLLEEKNEEIIASIRYAKRIQDALLTPQKYIERNINRLKSSLNSKDN